MNVLQVLSIIFLVCFSCSITKAQADCLYGFSLYVFDDKGKIINNATVNFRGYKLKVDGDTNSYNYSNLYGCNSTWEETLTVSFNGFDKFKKEIKLEESWQSFRLFLKKKKSSQPIIFEELSVLEGQIKDKNEVAIPNIKVILIDKNGKKNETSTNKYGYYHLDIESGIYTLEILGTEVFASQKFENYKLDKEYKNLDVILDMKK